MKSLCVRQPYAEMIARGRKRREIRSWDTAYRGPLLIVASAQLAYGASEIYSDAKLKVTREDTPRSTAVCIVDLVDILEIRRDGWDDLAMCDVTKFDLVWILKKPRRVTPFFVSGKLNLFELPDQKIRLTTTSKGRAAR